MLKDQSNWERIAPHLDRALDLEGAQRDAWLRQLAETDPLIAQTVREMLAEIDALNSTGYLEGAPLPSTSLEELLPTLDGWVRKRVAEESPDLLRKVSPQTGLRVGDVIGLYRLIREIGHGGMSTVWLAERVDGQLAREVALKLPFAGVLHSQLAQRFQHERDILARLTHPNIARLYDAGITESGQSYLAMEYVRGSPLTYHCDHAKLSIRERLHLFLQVLSAVEFAHSQLVLHRDLKPSNILVTDPARVVLLDFGIAKELASDFSLTEIATRALTPDYASPEHIEGNALSTTSDVYSLGVVLYELLAGVRPFGWRGESRRELEEAIATKIPPRPSQLELGLSVATARHSTPRRLAQTLKGDLDTIVLKALKKVPAERYRSISAFASDIENYLGNLPVSARPDSVGYRVGRFVTRHRFQVIAATATLLGINSVGVVAAWQAHEAGRERDRAVALAKRNEAINDFMDMLISQAASADKPVTVSQMLDRSVELAMSRTDVSPENHAAILGSIAGLYDVSGNNSGRAIAVLEQALALLRSSRDTTLKAELTCIHAGMSGSHGPFDAAISAVDGVLADRGLDDRVAAQCFHIRSMLAERVGDPAGTLLYANLALQHVNKATPKTPMQMGTVLGRVAVGYVQVGDLARANHYFELALRKYADAGRGQDPSTNFLLNNWGVGLLVAAPRQSLELFDRLLQQIALRDPGAPPPAGVVHNRAHALELLGRFAEARSAYQYGLKIAADSRSLNFEAFCLLGLASVAERLGDRDAALQYLTQLTPVQTELHAPESPLVFRRAMVDGRLDLAAGRLDRARERFELAASRHHKSPTTVGALLGKAEVDLAEQDSAAALANANAARLLATSLQGTLEYSNNTGLAWLTVGRALLAQGNRPEAHEAFLTAVSHLSNTVDESHPELQRARGLAVQ